MKLTLRYDGLRLGALDFVDGLAPIFVAEGNRELGTLLSDKTDGNSKPLNEQQVFTTL